MQSILKPHLRLDTLSPADKSAAPCILSEDNPQNGPISSVHCRLSPVVEECLQFSSDAFCTQNCYRTLSQPSSTYSCSLLMSDDYNYTLKQCHALADGNQRIRIGQKTLEFCSTVLSACTLSACSLWRVYIEAQSNSYLRCPLEVRHLIELGSWRIAVSSHSGVQSAISAQNMDSCSD